MSSEYRLAKGFITKTELVDLPVTNEYHFALRKGWQIIKGELPNVTWKFDVLPMTKEEQEHFMTWLESLPDDD